jgi:hypothetical protein
MRWRESDCRAALLIRNNHCRRNGPACAAASLIIAVMSPPEGAGGAGSGEAMLRNSTSHGYPVFTRDRYR